MCIQQALCLVNRTNLGEIYGEIYKQIYGEIYKQIYGEIYKQIYGEIYKIYFNVKYFNLPP
jgi:hypothetical protein